jgi:ribosomal-protein-alanine N-acetyltransferase
MSNIILRPWQKEDAQQLATIANNKSIWNNVLDSFPSPYTVMDALQWIAKESTTTPVTKFAIHYNGKIVGSIGMNMQDDVYKNAVELGYFIGEPYWGSGIATEAIKVLVTHINQNNKIDRIFARVFEHNKASMKALQKAGFYLEGIQRKAAIKNNQILDVYVWVKLL